MVDIDSGHIYQSCIDTAYSYVHQVNVTATECHGNRFHENLTIECKTNNPKNARSLNFGIVTNDTEIT